MQRKRPSEVKVYDSLDAPAYIWDRVHSTSDLSWLMVKKKNVSRGIRSRLEKAWEKIYEEYIKEFGFSENLLSIKEKETEIALLKCELILTDNRTLKIFIKAAEEELQDLRGGIDKSNFMESKIAIESKFKFQINTMQTSIREFYSYLKHL